MYVTTYIMEADTRFLKKVSRLDSINSKNCRFLNRYLKPSHHDSFSTVGASLSLMLILPSTINRVPSTPITIATSRYTTV